MKLIIVRLLARGYSPLQIQKMTGISIQLIYYYNRKWNATEQEANELISKTIL